MPIVRLVAEMRLWSGTIGGSCDSLAATSRFIPSRLLDSNIAGFSHKKAE
jgi:hypothetical protein